MIKRYICVSNLNDCFSCTIKRLNMPHDDDQKCEEFSKENSPTFAYVMSRMLDHNTNPWQWSECSRSHITKFLE